MKNFLRFMTLNAVVAAACALSASAQQPTPSPDADDHAQFCTNLYTKWRDIYHGTAERQKAFYKDAKEFLSKCPDDEYRSYVERWVKKYEEALRGSAHWKEFDNRPMPRDWKGVIAAGKRISARDPENLGGLLMIIYAGRQGMAGKDGDVSLGPDALAAALKAMQFIEAGKADAFTPDKWKTFNFDNKEDALAWLNRSADFFRLNSPPPTAPPPQP